MSAAQAERRRGDSAYRIVWRWHFYAGLLVAPVLLVLAVTGALYLFNVEIERAWYASLMNVEPGAGPGRPAASPQAQEAAVRAAYPGATLRSVEWPHDERHVSQWHLETADGAALSVFVDPWQGRVVGHVDSDSRLMSVVSELHGELMLGRTGDTLVELAAGWSLVMLATGLVLWWPRRWRWQGVLVPRLASRGRRFWRDLHAIPALLNALLVAFLVMSGLPWSGFWGEQLARLGTLSEHTAPTPNFHAPPTRTPPASAQEDTGSHHHAPDRGALPWSVQQAPVPEGAGGAPTIGLQAVMAHAAQRGLDTAGPRLRVFYPDGPQAVYTLSLVPARAQDQRTLYIDPVDGRVLRDIGWQDYSALGRVVEWGVMAHLGRQFGEANRWLALGVCLVLVLTIVSGVVMWWRRRPAGSLGAPQAAGQRLPRGLVATMVATGVLLPLVGASMLVLWLGEWAWRRIAPPTAARAART